MPEKCSLIQATLTHLIAAIGFLPARIPSGGVVNLDGDQCGFQTARADQILKLIFFKSRASSCTNKTVLN